MCRLACDLFKQSTVRIDYCKDSTEILQDNDPDGLLLEGNHH